MRYYLTLVVGCLTVSGLTVVGCQPSSPLDRVEAQRAQYTAELQSFILEQQPVEAPEASQETQPAAPVNDVAKPAGEETEEVATEPEVQTNVVLDILISTEGEPLPGISVDYEQVDAEHNVKDRRVLYIETPNLVTGVGVQVSSVVEDVDYQEGDGFNVSVRSPVPEAEQSKYRELASVSP